MSVMFKMSVGSGGSGGANIGYITREKATQKEKERVWTQNIPKYVDSKSKEASYKERTADLREYMRQLEEDELAKPCRGNGKTRTHYRVVYSFDKEVSDEKAKEMVSQHLAENFPKARAVAALHRDTDNAHVHVQIAARQIDDRKVQLKKETYRSLDERWAKIYGREFGRADELEHAAKKNRWRAWMRQAHEAKQRGEKPPPRPKRVAHERNQVQERVIMARKQYGLEYADKPRTTGNQRPSAVTERAVTRGVAERDASRLSGRTANTLRRDTTLERGVGAERTRAVARTTDARFADERAAELGKDSGREAGSPPRAIGRGVAEDGLRAQRVGSTIQSGAAAGQERTDRSREAPTINSGGAETEVQSTETPQRVTNEWAEERFGDRTLAGQVRAGFTQPSEASRDALTSRLAGTLQLDGGNPSQAGLLRDLYHIDDLSMGAIPRSQLNLDVDDALQPLTDARQIEQTLISPGSLHEAEAEVQQSPEQANAQEVEYDLGSSIDM
jgi:hypothetical protein